MSTADRQQVSNISEQLEEVWTALDTLFVDINVDDWQKSHGPDWVFADLPYHLAYVDHYAAVYPIEMGKDMPEAEQLSLASFGALNKWNQEKFSQRPASQTVADSIAQMETNRQKLRAQLAEMTDADLMNPAWFFLLGHRGFRPALYHLMLCVGHTWSHYSETRLRRGITESAISAEAETAIIGLNIPIIGLFFDAQKATELKFSFGIKLSEPMNKSWLLQPANQQWDVTESPLDNATLALTCTVNGFAQIRSNMINRSSFPNLIASGDLKVNDINALETLSQLFISEDYVFPVNP